MKFFHSHDTLHKYPVPPPCQTRYENEYLYILRPRTVDECPQCFLSQTQRTEQQAEQDDAAPQSAGRFER